MRLTRVCLLCAALFFQPATLAADVYTVQLYFGLSVPDGGEVSAEEWARFRDEQIVKRFDGFNVISSKGYWKGEPEPAKIVTIVMEEDQLAEAEVLAKTYAEEFKQDSVMLVKYPVSKLEFVHGEQK